MDDLFLIWPDNVDFDVFFNALNNLHPTIKFKCEWENEGKLPFLDMTVHKTDNEVSFSIYRKPTNSCSYIHYFSAHSNKVKLAVASSMFLRAYRLCSPSFIDEEISNIVNIFKELKYPVSFISKAHTKARKRFFTAPPAVSFNVENKKIICLPYNEGFECLNHVFRDSERKFVFKYPNTLGKSLIRNKPRPEGEAGVYQIPCKDCNLVYYGETGRPFPVRLEEHKNDVKNCKESNAAFLHKIRNDHVINWNDAKILFRSNDYFKRRLVESSLIGSFPNFNISEGHFKFSNILQTAILKAVGLNGIT